MVDEFGREVPEPVQEQVSQPQVDPNVLALAMGIQNDPVRLAALAQSYVPQQPQAQAPVAPVVQPWEDPDVIEELNSLQFSNQTEYNRRMMELSTQRAMAQMQPQMQAANNAGYVQQQLLVDVRSRGMTPQETAMLEQEAYQVIQDLQRSQPERFINPQQALDMAKRFMNARSWELQQARAGQQPNALPIMARNMGGPGQQAPQGPRIQPTETDVLWAGRFGMTPERYAFQRMEKEAGR
jgi:hypothetical protein